MRYSFCLSLSILAILLCKNTLPHCTNQPEHLLCCISQILPCSFSVQSVLQRGYFSQYREKRHRFREHCKSSLHVLCSRKMPALVSDIAWQEQQPDRCFSHDALCVQFPLASDNKVCIDNCLFQLSFPHNDLNAGFQFSVQVVFQRKSQSACGSAARTVGVTFRKQHFCQLGISGKPIVHLGNCCCISTFLRCKNSTAPLFSAEWIGDITCHLKCAGC